MGRWRLFCASVCCSAIGACSRADRGTEAATVTAAPQSSTPTLAPSLTPAPAPDPLLTAAPLKARSIGHTSFVLKVKLDDGEAAAFKPRSHKPLGDRRYRAEIAAYRLAHALGLDNVPRAEPRSFDAKALRSACATGGAGNEFDQLALPDGDGRVRGAIMPWIADYHVLPLEQPAWRAKWTAWLTDSGAVIPDDQRDLARSVSTMIVFDYVTANWDRWSGANVAVDGATGTTLFVDNDGAFYEAPPADTLARQLALLSRVVRFSRTFVTTLHELDADKLAAALGDESAGVALLPPSVVAAADERRRRALESIDAKGDAALAFP